MTHPQREAEAAAVYESGEAALAQAARSMRRKPDRPEVIRLALLAAVVVSLFMGAASIGVSYLAFRSAADAVATGAANADQARNNQELAQQAYDKALAANAQLAAQGKAPVPVPAPTSEDPTQTLVAAATAQVLAKLPNAQQTAAEIAQAVATYMLANPPGPTAVQIVAAVSAYLTANPPPAGPKGETGEPGPAPTAQQILAAVQSYCSAHNDCIGPQGAQGVKGDAGVPGVSVTRQYFARTDTGECHNFNDFSDGTTVDQGAAGDAACPPIEPAAPTTTGGTG